MGKNSRSPCSYFLAAALLAFIALLAANAIRSLRNPRAVENLVESAKGLGFCLGIIAVGFAVMVLVALVSAKRNENLLVWRSRDYPVRCIASSLERGDEYSPSAEPEQSLPGDPSAPIYLIVAVSSFGVRLSGIQPHYSWACIPIDNAARYLALVGPRYDPVILPTGYFSLYYVRYSWRGALRMKLRPTHGRGFSGPLPKSMGTDTVEIIVAYSATMDEADPPELRFNQGMITLSLVVLDEEGHEHPSGSRDLYNAILDFLESQSSADEYY